MKKNKVKQINGYKKFLNKWVLSALGILWILSTIFAYQTLRQPLKVEEKVIDNNISQKTSFDYKVEVIACTLFPNGGIVDPNDSMYTKIVKAIHLNLVSDVKSDKPVAVLGTRSVVVKLIAEGLWERDFVLEAEKDFNLQGNENKILQNDYVIDVKNIEAYIEKVEKEIAVRPDKYLLNIKPEFKGNVIYEGKEFPIDSTPEVSFEFSSLIKLIGEKEFTKETPIETTKILNHNFRLINIVIPIMSARYIFSILSLLMFGIIVFRIYKNININKKEMPEADKIDKKYKNRLTLINRNITILNKINVSVKSFKSLIQLADDKEQPVLRYKNSDIDRIFYYVIDGDCIYSYSADDKDENLSLMEVSTSATGNDIQQNQ